MRREEVAVAPLCVMVGPGPTAQGGVASVIGVYKDAGLFAAGDVRLLESYSARSRWAKLNMAASAAWQYTGLLLRGHGAVLHVHVSSHASFWRKAVFIWMARWAGRRVVFHLHGGGFQAFIESLPARRRAVALRTIRCSHEILCLSSPVADWLKTIAPDVPVRWWPNPVPADLFADDEPDAHPREPLLLYLGALLPAKGLDDLLAAFGALHRHDPKAKLLIGGMGPLHMHLQAMAAEAGLGDSVVLLGWVGAAEKAALLRRARVLALASHLESQPMVLLEAMASGAAVVSTKVGGIPDMMVDGVDGLLVEAGEPEQLAQALLSIWDDDTRRARLVASARRRVIQRHRAPDACAALRELYQSLAIKA